MNSLVRRFSIVHKKYLRKIFLSCQASQVSGVNVKLSSPIPNKYSRKYNPDNENTLAHEVLEKIAAYSSSLILHPTKIIENDCQKWQVSGDGIIKTFSFISFQNLKEQRTFAAPEFTNVAISLTKSIPGASFDTLQHVLFCLCLWPLSPTTMYIPNFQLVWTTIDKECTKQLENWSIEKKLLIADFWFHLRLSRVSQYNTKMIKHLIPLCNKLSHNQFVQLMFYINLQRNVPQHLIDVLTTKLESVIDAVSLPELSVICLGYFKTENKISNNNILKSILHKTCSEIDNVDSVTIVRLLKFLRKSFQPHLVQFYVPLLKGCTTNLQRWNLWAAVQATLFSSTSYIFEPLLLDVVVEKLKDEICTARLKDICKVVQCLSQFNYMPSSDFHKLLFEEVMKPDRLIESEHFPRDFLYLLLFYAYMGEFPLHIIKYVLSDHFIDHALMGQQQQLITSLAVLDYCVELECDQYDGPRLKPYFRNILLRSRSNTDTERDQSNIIVNLTKKVMNTLNSILSPDDFMLRRVLPHIYTPDIVVKLTKNTQSLSLKQRIAQHSELEIVRPPPNESWACLIICGPFTFPFKSKQLCGLLTMKRRQLIKLGYKVALVPFSDVPFDEERRKLYLKRKLDALYKDEESIL